MSNIEEGHHFELQTNAEGHSLIVLLEGRIDSVNAEDFETQLNWEIKGYDDRAVILDFSNLAYISSAGLRVILQAAKMRGGASTRIMLCAVPDAVMQIIKIAGFDRVIDIFSDAATAANTAKS